jgi:hypothetical protein
MTYFKKWWFIIIIVIIIVIGFESFAFESFANNVKDSKNIALIGDSILNNSVYVFEKQSVPELITFGLIKDNSNSNRKCYNFAKDGSIISDCYNQLSKLNTGTTSGTNSNINIKTIFVSAGGNNILNSFISINSDSTVFINNLFAEYLKLIDAIKTEYPSAAIVVLNLYYPLKQSFKSFYPLIKQWNQLISDNSIKHGFKIIKLDELIIADEDVVYDVEPSFIGGQKIANAICSY